MKKILILSINEDDSTTNVMKWIHYFNPNIQVVRLHFEHLIDGIFSHDIYSDNIKMELNKTSFSTDEIGVVWMRKWHPNISISAKDKFIKKHIENIKCNIEQEVNQWYAYFLYHLEQKKHIYWFNHPQYILPNKLIQLKKAIQVGLKIPQSFVGNVYPQNIKCQSLITKPLSHCINLQYSNKLYINYTSRINTNNDTKDLFISYFQEEIKKLLELRVFYLAGQCYVIAIHSQDNSQTEVDYRRYDFQNFNRYEYYELPNDLIHKIEIFMQSMNLQTGSLDFILTPEGKYVFLEVNPCGQYDIFNLCNVYPDKLIAEHLISKL